MHLELLLLRRVGQGEVCSPGNTDGGYERLQRKYKVSPCPRSAPRSATIHTYNLELDGHNAEVEDLHRRPENEVGLESRQEDVSELAAQRSSSTTLGDSHKSEKACQTYTSTVNNRAFLGAWKGHSVPKGAKMN